MPFEVVPTVIVNPKPEAGKASISYSRVTSKKSGGVPRGLPKLNIGLPSAISGFKAGDKAKTYVFMIGTGTDRGVARIVENRDGTKGRVVRGGGLAFRFGHVPRLGTDAAAKEFVAVKAIDRGFEIALPEWFK